MHRFARDFLKDDSGAITVDWVVLTAAVVGLGIAVVNSIGPSLTQLGQNISAVEIEIDRAIGGQSGNGDQQDGDDQETP